MSYEIDLYGKFISTIITLVRIRTFPRMDCLVLHQIAFFMKCFGTDITGVGLLAGVPPDMGLQGITMAMTFATYRTLERI